jgi:hypothetical protein
MNELRESQAWQEVNGEVVPPETVVPIAPNQTHVNDGDLRIDPEFDYERATQAAVETVEAATPVVPEEPTIPNGNLPGRETKEFQTMNRETALDGIAQSRRAINEKSKQLGDAA